MITVSVYKKGERGISKIIPLKSESFDDSEREMAYSVMDKIDLDRFDVVIVYHASVSESLFAKFKMSPFFDAMKPEFAPYEGNRAEYRGEA
jgi:hypothetical protein